MRRLVVLALVALPALASAEKCVELAAGTPVYAGAGAREAAAKTTGAVVGFVEKAGRRTLVRVETLADAGKHRKVSSHAAFWVKAGDARPASCPARETISELTLISEVLGLYWRDGDLSGSMSTGDAVDQAAGSKDRVTIKGEERVCFDRLVAAGLVLHLCGSCEQLRAAASRQIGSRVKVCE